MIKTFLRTFFPWIILAHSILFLAFWLSNRLFCSTTNDYLSNLLHNRKDYISISLAISGLVAFWSILQIISSRLSDSSWLLTLLSILYIIITLVYLVFFYGGFQMLFSRSPSQLPRIGQLLAYYRILLDSLLLLGTALFTAFWLRRWLALHPDVRLAEILRVAAPLLFVYTVLWILPLVFPPGSVYRGKLIKKPSIIAHRGASMLAPENTLVSAQMAADLGVYGVETDLHISLDGVPFLMHDDTLKRTTNVADIFPGRENDRAEAFTMVEIQQLEAGSWFNRLDPFRTIAANLVSTQDQQKYLDAKIPTLAEELELIRKSGSVFIFDLKQPPDGHPYHDRYFDIVFKEVKQAGIDPQIWYLVDAEQAKIIQASAPEMKLVVGLDYRRPQPADKLRAAGYQIVNSDFGLPAAWIRVYRDAGLWVNLFTVEEPWQFSHFWLSGVESITTSNTAQMQRLAQPVWSLAYRSYLELWLLLGLFGSGMVLALLFLR